MECKIIPADESLFQINRVYAVIDHIEPEYAENNQPCDVYLDCVDSRWIDRSFAEAEPNLQYCAEAPASIIRLQTRYGSDIFTNAQLMHEAGWLQIDIGTHGIPIEHYASINHAPVVRYLTGFSRLRSNVQRKLGALTSLRSVPEASKQQLFAWLKNVRQHEYVAIYDVGQGNANALCNQRGIPLVYFDFGGGTTNNAKTYPTSIRFCFEAKPLVILSHWDWDHWASGDRHNEAMDLPWLAPDQMIGVNHAKFAAKLLRRNNLFVWPRRWLGLSNFNFGFLRITKCNGQGRNHSGLAMLAKDNNDLGVLLPGDAAYDKIPMGVDQKLKGLVATHHGGLMKRSFIPRPKLGIEQKIAYSFGLNNTFNHPFTQTVAAHQRAGWTNEVSTCQPLPRGNVGIGVNGVVIPACNLTRCTMRIDR